MSLYKVQNCIMYSSLLFKLKAFYDFEFVVRPHIAGENTHPDNPVVLTVEEGLPALLECNVTDSHPESRHGHMVQRTGSLYSPGAISAASILRRVTPA